MTNCMDVSAAFDDYLDGRLDAEADASIAAHLDRCSDCSQELSELRELRKRAGALRRTIEPPRDLWPAIEGRINQQKVVRARLRRHVLVAAAVVILLLGSVAAYVVGRAARPRLVDARPAAAAEAQRQLQAAFAELGVHDFERSRAELVDALAARRHELSPETREVIDENLAMIDGAMARIADALGEDPNSELLMRQLAGAYQQQISLLERAVRLPADV